MKNAGSSTEGVEEHKRREKRKKKLEKIPVIEKKLKPGKGE